MVGRSKRLAVFVLLTLSALPAGATPRGKRAPRPPVASAPTAQFNTAGGAADLAPLGADSVGRPGPQCRPRRNPLTYHGGKLVTNPDVFLIFWGSQWNSDPEHLFAKADLLSFYQQVGSSGYACAWKEYGVPGQAYGTTTLDNMAPDIVASPPPNPLPDAAIQQKIQDEIAAGRAPARTDDMVYIVVPAKGVPVDIGGETGCGGSNFVFCGYHDSFGTFAAPFRYAVLPYPCNQNFYTCFVDANQTPGKALQSVGSHELAELVTDPDSFPVGNSGWYSNRDGQENADICTSYACGVDLPIGTVNSFWSNLSNGCIDSVPCTPAVDCTDTTPGNCVTGLSGLGKCTLEWLVYPNLTHTAAGLPGRTVTCSDGQPFCDFDNTVDGACTFHVAACLNSQDPRVSCSAASITNVKLVRPLPTSTNATDSANATRLLTALSTADPGSTGTQSGAQIAYSPVSTSANACTTFVDIVVPLRTVGTRTLRGVRTVIVTANTTTTPSRNLLTLFCTPPQ
jgi:hypothetical protein